MKEFLEKEKLVKNKILVLVVASLAVSAALASKARQAALQGADVPPVESSLSISIERRDINSFNKAMKKDVSETELNTALENAAAAEDSSYLAALMKEKAKSKELAQKNSNILSAALSDGSLKNVEILEANIKSEDIKFDEGRDVLRQAISVSSSDKIQLIAKKHSSLISKMDENGESILFTAIRRGDRQIVDEVLKMKALPASRTNKKGQTAQALALELGYKRIAEKVK